MLRTVRGTIGTKAANWITGLLCLGIVVPLAWGAAEPQTVTNPEGHAIRKVYVRTESPQSVSHAIASLARNTCLTIVPTPKEADAVVTIGQALHHPVVSAMPTPHVFGPSGRGEAAGDVNSHGQPTPSPNCENQRSAGCGPPGGDVAPLPADWPGNAGKNLRVELVTVGSESELLWEPTRASRKYWTHQLRIAVGCPVCPGEHFDHHKYKSYRSWIHKQCPEVLKSEVGH